MSFEKKEMSYRQLNIRNILTRDMLQADRRPSTTHLKSKKKTRDKNVVVICFFFFVFQQKHNFTAFKQYFDSKI